MGMRHDDAVKAAVIADLLNGLRISEAAEKHNLPVGTVKSWAHRMRTDKDSLLVTEDRAERIGDLVFDNLEAMLRTQNAILNHVSTQPQWLERQDASDLAILFGVISDKAFRILEALPEGDARQAADFSGVHSEGLAEV